MVYRTSFRGQFASKASEMALLRQAAAVSRLSLVWNLIGTVISLFFRSDLKLSQFVFLGFRLLKFVVCWRRIRRICLWSDPKSSSEALQSLISHTLNTNSNIDYLLSSDVHEDRLRTSIKDGESFIQHGQSGS